MSEYLKTYGSTLGPIDVPMSDDQAFALDELFKTLPEEDRTLRKVNNPAAMITLEEGERADISWITTEAIDRDKEIVLADGMRDTHYKLNPLVTLGHAYYMPPVGKSLWRKPSEERRLKGVLAKTLYPAKPKDWQESWAPDEVLMLMQAGLMNGKSIGFIALKGRAPTEKEVEKRPEYAQVRRIIEEWLLIEYACCPIPCNPATVVTSVSKSVREALGWTEPAAPPTPAPPPAPEVIIPNFDHIKFTTYEEVEQAIKQQFGNLDLTDRIETLADQVLDRHRGRV